MIGEGRRVTLEKEGIEDIGDAATVELIESISKDQLVFLGFRHGMGGGDSPLQGQRDRERTHVGRTPRHPWRNRAGVRQSRLDVAANRGAMHSAQPQSAGATDHVLLGRVVVEPGRGCDWQGLGR